MKRSVALLLLLLSISTLAIASRSNAADGLKLSMDTGLTNAIKNILDSAQASSAFHYPQTVRRLYIQSRFEPVWFTSKKDIRKTWEALMLLNCVMQFGLSYADYHAKELSYKNVHHLVETPTRISIIERARLDLLLSDALISLINHLHFGKLNPKYSSSLIDQAPIAGFSAEGVLLAALGQQDLIVKILNVQPKDQKYVDLQNYIKQLKGIDPDECYEDPPAIIKKVAINMERLRWAATDESTYITINIPAYTLKLHTPDTVYQFKVVVGKPTSPTPVLQSSITYFETAPDWNVPKSIFINELLPKVLKNPDYLNNNHLAIYNRRGEFVPPIKDSLLQVKRNPHRYTMRQSPGCDNALGLVVFRFQNDFSVYLHDTPQKQFFDQEFRALSHGCIRVQHAEKLATTLLTLDGQQHQHHNLRQAMIRYHSKLFKLRRSIPLIINYITCDIADGLIIYDDVYHLDKAMELALYRKM